jgi:hypothetical protein
LRYVQLVKPVLELRNLRGGIPMDIPAHVEHLDPKPELLREFCGHLTKPGDETVVLYADGKPVEIPVL